MTNVARFEGMIGDVNVAAAEVEASEKELKAAKIRHSNLGAVNERKIFFELADDDGVLRGEGIADFVEASMRIAGQPRPTAESAGEQLAGVFSPSADGGAKPFYITESNGTFRSDGILVVANSKSHQPSQPEFSLRPADYGDHSYVLKVEAEGEIDLFAQRDTGYSPITNARHRAQWLLKDAVEVQLDIGETQLVSSWLRLESAKRADKHGNRQPVMYLGEAVPAVIEKDNKNRHNRDDYIHSPEAVAILALLGASTGHDSKYKFVEQVYRDSYAVTHTEHVLGCVTETVEGILESRSGYGRWNLVKDGAPVMLHQSILGELGIGDDEFSQAVLLGLAQSDVLTDEHIARLTERLPKSHRNFGPILDEALIGQVDRISTQFAAMRHLGVTGVSQADVILAAEMNPSLYQQAVMPRREIGQPYYRDSDLSNAIYAYFDRSPRFAAGRTAEREARYNDYS